MLKLYQLGWRHEQELLSVSTAVPIFNWRNEWRYFRFRAPLCIGIGFTAAITWQLVIANKTTEAPSTAQKIRQSSMHYLFPERQLPAKPLALTSNIAHEENATVVPEMIPVQNSVTPDLRERLEQAIREQNAGNGKSHTN